MLNDGVHASIMFFLENFYVFAFQGHLNHQKAMIRVQTFVGFIMTIFNEETFSLKSGLQKGPRKLKIKNLQ